MFFENYFQKRLKQAKNEIISNLSKNYLLKTVVGSKLFLETVFTDLKTSVRSTNHLRIFIQQGKAKELAQSKHNRKLKRFAFFFFNLRMNNQNSQAERRLQMETEEEAQSKGIPRNANFIITEVMGKKLQEMI